jgi:hypothetical protein
MEDLAVEWTTESEEQTQTAGHNGHGETQPLPAQPVSSPPPVPDPIPQAPPVPNPAPVPPAPTQETPVPPAAAATPPAPPPPVPTHAAPAPAQYVAPSGFDQCPSCGAWVAADQRYCLECGHRRGDPRLPFMDAVVFMDAMNRPPEAAGVPRKQQRKISPNAALIAGVGTLLLALGIGVLIGRSGNHSSAPASQAPIVIKGGTREEAATASTSGETIGGSGTEGKSKKQVVKAKKKAAETGEGAEKVLHTAPGVNPPPATVKIGEKCDKKVAGCSKNGKFEGTFFGE